MSGDARMISPTELKRIMRILLILRMGDGETYLFLKGFAKIRIEQLREGDLFLCEEKNAKRYIILLTKVKLLSRTPKLENKIQWRFAEN